ncbi:hypothetical protein ONZ45_g5447 [Pleurotus djamor]|nr:hypothetical protein ONZ45_g5447 [Pleurotus djamor]
MMSFRPPQCPLPLPPVNVRDALPSTPSTPLTTLVQYCTSSAESILSWAEQVQPGTPAPLTPPSDSTTTSASSSTSSLASAPSSGGGKKKTRRPSVSRLHLNLSARRPSGVQHSQARSGSASFMNIIDTPSTGPAQPQPQSARTPMSSKSLNAGSYDLTNLGYTSVFVRLPHPPATPAHLINTTYNTTTPANPNASTSNLNQRDDSGGVKRTLNRIRSFSILRRAAQPKTPPPVPALPSDTPPVPPMPAIFSKSSSFNKLPSSPTVAVQKKKDMYPVTKAKKDTKAVPKKTKTPLPPTLASELALMQFLDGGNMDEAIQRVMDAQAKASLPAGRTESKETRAHGVVYRDENGGVWMDKDEEMEYKHLLATSPTISSPSASSPGLSTPGHPSSPFLMCASWIKFESTSPTKENSVPLSGVTRHRRGASFSLTMHAVKPAEEEGLHGQFVRLPALIAAAPSTGDARTSRRPRTPGSPSKSKRYGMIYERSRSRVSGRPRRGTVTSILPESSLSSACTSESSDDDRRYATSATSVSTSSTSARKVRRRPAPLALVPPSSSFAGRARKEFLDESFAPAPLLAATQPASAGLGSFVDVGLAISVVPPPRGSSLPVPGDDFAMAVDKPVGGMMRSVKKKASRMALWRK